MPVQGPYNIVTTCLCLEYVCQSIEDDREGLAKLARLLKPGGTLLLMQSDENVDAWIFAGMMIQTHPISLPYDTLPADVPGDRL